MNPPESQVRALRTGFTTGACAAAVARAAVRLLCSAEVPTAIEIDLPKGTYEFRVHCTTLPGGEAQCSVIKDAGDDPDVTHGLEINARAAWSPQPGIVLHGGEGVGTVTLPGLPVAVGEPAINPAPRRMIRAAVAEELRRAGRSAAGVEVVISVPAGQEIAAKTMNPRLGVCGGISILGTDGLVHPYSAPAYRASVHYACRVAAQSGRRAVVFSTGRRSEAYAARLLDLPDEIGLVNVGDDVGYALKQAQRLGLTQVVLAGMVGKISKLAQGRLNTHVDEGGVDFAFLAGLAQELGWRGDTQALHSARTAHAVQAQLKRAGVSGLEALLARRAAHALLQAADGLQVRVLLFSLHGDLLADEAAGGDHA